MEELRQNKGIQSNEKKCQFDSVRTQVLQSHKYFVHIWPPHAQKGPAISASPFVSKIIIKPTIRTFGIIKVVFIPATGASFLRQ